MYSFQVRLSEREQARQAARRLVDEFKVTGEISTSPLAGGLWLLSVDAEASLPEAWLAGLQDQISPPATPGDGD
ncbi:MAG TPA: hypothetical protein DEQ28_01540 [Clostridiales bacterium]|nr:hypothetical protein [Clostridiales bacterium]